MKNNVRTISLGIRHQRSFRLPEIAGSIIDFILRDDLFPFDKNFFQSADSLISDFENKGKILIGSDGVSSMIIDTDSIIFNLKYADLDTGIEFIKDRLIPYLRKIFNQFKIENINRIGVVFEFDKVDLNIIEEITKKATNSVFDRNDHFVFRFSHKDRDVMSLAKKDILDYVNYIITVSKDEKDKSFAKFDYQFYYSPDINSIEDIDFNLFLEKASSQLDLKFFKWVNKNEKQR